MKVHRVKPAVAKAVMSTDASDAIPKGAARNQRSLYFTLKDASRKHAYLRAAVSSIGRSIIGPGYSFVKHPRFGEEATDKQLETLWNFYHNIGLIESGVQELELKQPLIARLYKTVGAFRLFGGAFWEIRRNRRGVVLGSVTIDGYLHPHVGRDGSFLSPAWYQYANEVGKPVPLEYDDVVPFMWPDYSASGYTSDIEALVEYTLSSDIYMLLSIRELFKNMRAPFGFWSIDPNVSDDVYEEFKQMVDNLYTGAKNFGRSALTTRGMVDYKPVAQNISDVPWQAGHHMARDESFSVIGTNAQKMGLEEAGSGVLEELRREHWETTTLPLTRMLEDMMWQEVNVRLFGIRGWMLKFNKPDFTTALQDASIEMRRIQWGQWSPNDARLARGEPPREGGDYYLIPLNMAIQGEQGGAEDPVDAASAEPKPEDEEPVPDSEPPERVEDAISTFRRYLMTDVERQRRRNRKFQSDVLPQDVIDAADVWLTAHGLTAEAVDEFIRALEDVLL